MKWYFLWWIIILYDIIFQYWTSCLCLFLNVASWKTYVSKRLHRHYKNISYYCTSNVIHFNISRWFKVAFLTYSVQICVRNYCPCKINTCTCIVYVRNLVMKYIQFKKNNFKLSYSLWKEHTKSQGATPLLLSLKWPYRLDACMQGIMIPTHCPASTQYLLLLLII